MKDAQLRYDSMQPSIDYSDSMIVDLDSLSEEEYEDWVQANENDLYEIDGSYNGLFR